MADKPTERAVARCLAFERFRRNFVLPRYTPRNWWECDLFEITDAGYFREYEIKLTRADFAADRVKSKTDHQIVEGRWQNIERLKYREFRSDHPARPVQFWYVTPMGMVKPEEVPEFAGLIEFEWRSTRKFQAVEREVKKAPRLHQIKIDPAIRAHAESTCYWRMHHLMNDVDEMEMVEPT